MTAITFVFIILMLIYIINGNKKIRFYIENILKQKINNKTRDSFTINKPLNKKKNKMPITTNNKFNNSTKEMVKLKNRLKIKQNLNKKLIQNSLKKSLKKLKNNKNFPPKKQKHLITLNDTYKKSRDELMSLPNKNGIKTVSKNSLLKIKKREKIIQSKKNYKVLNNNKKILTEQSNKELIAKQINKNNKLVEDKNKINNLNDEELNSLEYEIATVIDKRTFFQYYYS